MTVSTKPRVAFFDFTGCEGCQLTIIDALQTHADLLGAVEIVQFREAMSERGEEFEIAFVEGSCSTASDRTRLQSIRDQAQVVVALGACAHLGGVNALRDRQSPDEVRRYVYGQAGKRFEAGRARPIAEIIDVDCIIPGCPIDQSEFINTVKALLQHRLPQLPDFSVCCECKMREIACLFGRGVACLGSITRGGCGAICPAYGAYCAGCRGLVDDPNLGWLRAASMDSGLDEDRIDMALRLFLSHALLESEVFGNG